MSIAITVSIIISVIAAATPLLLAATGELVTERSGVLNLGVEGMMLMGAVTGVAATLLTGSWFAGVVTAAVVGAAFSLIFGVLVLTLRANQVASGLALTIFGTGLSAVVGTPFVGRPLARLPVLDAPILSDLPIVGPLLFSHDVLVYVSIGMLLAVAWFLNRSRLGLILRAVGESHDSAHAIGYHVIAIRYGAVAFGGMMAGLAGAHISLALTPFWAENMTAGRGWIALALIVFASWRPLRVLAGAYLFGAVTIAQLHVQGFGIPIPSQFLSALPYLATVIVLVIISSNAARVRLNAPACIGKAFAPAA